MERWELDGISALKVESLSLVPQIIVKVKPEIAALHGLTDGQIRQAMTTLISRRKVSEVYQDQRVHEVQAYRWPRHEHVVEFVPAPGAVSAGEHPGVGGASAGPVSVHLPEPNSFLHRRFAGTGDHSEPEPPGTRGRQQAEQDYKIHLKAEIEIRHLPHHRSQRLLEIQQIQNGPAAVVGG
jgi:hypothetical protein